MAKNGLNHRAIRSHSAFEKPMKMSDVGMGGCTISACFYLRVWRTLKLPVLAHTWRLTHEPVHPQCPLRLTELKQTIREQRLDVKFHNCKSCPTMEHRARSCLHIGVNDCDFYQHCCSFSLQRVLANDLVYTHGHCGDISGCCGVPMVSGRREVNAFNLSTSF